MEEDENGILPESTNAHQEQKTISCYACHNRDECNEEPLPTCIGAIKCYTIHTTDSHGYEDFRKGCIKADDLHDKIICRKSPKIERSRMMSAKCCADQNFCNNLDAESFREMHQPYHRGTAEDGISFWPSVISISCLFIIIAITIIILRRRKKRLNRRNDVEIRGFPMVPESHELLSPFPNTSFSKSSIPSPRLQIDGSISNVTTSVLLSESQDEGPSLHAVPVGDSTLRDIGVFDPAMTSGSGAGGRRLIPKSLANDIILESDAIGKGRFGEVRKGFFHGNDPVAVKIILSHEHDSFKRECDFYALPLIANEFILNYRGADIVSKNSVTQLWIVTDFHPLGSLHDYLKLHELSFKDALAIAYTATKGLEHLHVSAKGTLTKPRIAHRDIKSKNFLVRNPSLFYGHPSICIGDFGYAVWETDETIVEQAFREPRKGTKRYMPPEILDETTKLNSFDSLIYGDIYSFALVLWETFRRVEWTAEVSGKAVATVFHAEDYMIPYEGDVSIDPSFDEMKSLVLHRGVRPAFPDSWEERPEMTEIKQMIAYCWNGNPTVRLSASRIKKTLHRVMNGIGLRYEITSDV